MGNENSYSRDGRGKDIVLNDLLHIKNPSRLREGFLLFKQEIQVAYP